MTETGTLQTESSGQENVCAYHLLRYVPNLVRDEWVNIGVLVFNPKTGERRLRMIEEPEEYARVRRLHPWTDESVLRRMRDHLENRVQFAESTAGGGIAWQQVLSKWDDTLSNVLQMGPLKGVQGGHDLDMELERLYTDHVALQRTPGRIGAAGSRAALRSYCSQVFRHAQLWNRLEKSVRAEEYTFPGDPMRLDYSYRRNGTRGFVQTLSVTRSPADAKLLAYTAQRITTKARLKTEFTAVTDVFLEANNERHTFVRDTLRDVGIEPVPLEGFAVWVAKLKPLLM